MRRQWNSWKWNFKTILWDTKVYRSTEFHSKKKLNSWGDSKTQENETSNQYYETKKYIQVYGVSL